MEPLPDSPASDTLQTLRDENERLKREVLDLERALEARDRSDARAAFARSMDRHDQGRDNNAADVNVAAQAGCPMRCKCDAFPCSLPDGHGADKRSSFESDPHLCAFCRNDESAPTIASSR